MGKKVWNILASIVSGYFKLAAWCLIIGLILTAIVIPIVALFGGLPGWVVWVELAALVVFYFIYRNVNDTTKKPKANNLEKKSLEELLSLASEASKKAKKAKDDAVAATTQEAAKAEEAKAKKQVELAEKIVEEVGRRLTADPTNPLINSAKTAIDSYHAEAKAAAREAGNAANRFPTSDPATEINKHFVTAMRNQGKAEDAKAEAEHTTDPTVARAAADKAVAAYRAAESAYNAAKAIVLANPDNEDFAYTANLIEEAKKAAKKAAEEATEAASVLSISPRDKAIAAFDAITAAKNDAIAANSAVSAAPNKAATVISIEKVKAAAKTAERELAKVQAFADANPDDAVIRSLVSEAESTVSYVKDTVRVAETMANSKPD